MSERLAGICQERRAGGFLGVAAVKASAAAAAAVRACVRQELKSPRVKGACAVSTCPASLCSDPLALSSAPRPFTYLRLPRYLKCIPSALTRASHSNSNEFQLLWSQPWNHYRGIIIDASGPFIISFSSLQNRDLEMQSKLLMVNDWTNLMNGAFINFPTLH